MADQLILRGVLSGHNGWVTAIATSSENPNLLVTASRDKTILIWTIVREAETFAALKRRLTGHNHHVQDLAISSDGLFLMSASWDKTLRLWDLVNGTCIRVFNGHEKDVLSVAFSPDNRQIISSSRDGTVRVWNTLAECKFVMKENGHTDWASCVRFSPNASTHVAVSCGWDKVVKVWDLNTFKLRSNQIGHTGYVSTVAISPDGSLCASGGADGTLMLWDLNEGKHLYSLEAGDVIHSLLFSPSRYWLCAATSKCIRIWDLESKQVVEEISPQFPNRGKRAQLPYCVSLAWSADGNTLFSGYTDNSLRVWSVVGGQNKA